MAPALISQSGGSTARAARSAAMSSGERRTMARSWPSAASLALALEVRDLVGLGVGPVLRVGELVLRLALALLGAAFATQRGVVGEVSGSLLGAAGHLVRDAHVASSVSRGHDKTYPMASAINPRARRPSAA